MVNGNRVFTQRDIEYRLNRAMNKTLGELDVSGIFEKHKNRQKVTGIAGDVIEQSVLGYAQNSDSEPDIEIDGKPVEVKTTGMLERKGVFSAKEPVSVTAVSIKKIIHEKDFEDSRFWHKAGDILFVYYHYDSDVKVTPYEYSTFKVKGWYRFQARDDDFKILKRDWEKVKQHLLDGGAPEALGDLPLQYLDVAPKYPNPPRFRFKRKYIDGIIQGYFNGELEKIPNVSAFSEIEQMLHSVSETYKGKNIAEIAKVFNLDLNTRDTSKSIAENIIIKMLDCKSKSLNQLDIFAKNYIRVQSITLNHKEQRTEDMKTIPVDFDEIQQGIEYEDSSLYEFLNSAKILLVMFKEQYRDSAKEKLKDIKYSLLDNEFLGFKFISLPKDLVEEGRIIWNCLDRLVNKGELKVSLKYTKAGKIRINKTGVPMESLNFPKSKDYNIFLRGTGTDSTNKNIVINGIRMYYHNYWLKGSYVVNLAKIHPFI